MGLKLPMDIIESAGVCQNCFIKFNEIDEHQIIAEKIQMELLGLFNSNSTTFTEVKEEEEQEEDNVKVEMGVNEDLAQNHEILEEYYVGDEEVVVADEEYEEYPKESKYMTNVITKIEGIKTSPGGTKRPYQRRKNPDAGLLMVYVDGIKLYKCDICERVCKDRYKLRNHRETHQTERTICCNECGAMFKTLGCLYSHRKLHKERTYHDW